MSSPQKLMRDMFASSFQMSFRRLSTDGDTRWESKTFGFEGKLRSLPYLHKSMKYPRVYVTDCEGRCQLMKGQKWWSKHFVVVICAKTPRENW
jgi:hypothetical protein